MVKYTLFYWFYVRIIQRISIMYRVQRKFEFSSFREHSFEISPETAGETKKKNWKMKDLTFEDRIVSDP